MINTDNDDARQRIADGEFEPAVTLASIQKGMRWRENKKSFAIVEIEYLADPSKDCREWEDSERKQYGERVWLREYKMHWIVHEGVRLYPEYFRDKHRSNETLEPWPGIPIVRGWDVGPLNRWFGCVALQRNKTLTRVLSEWLEADMALSDFTEAILASCKSKWPGSGYRDAVDKQCFDTKERLTSNQYSTVQAMKRAGLYSPRKAVSSMVVRHDAIKGALTRSDPSTGEAAYQHDPDCSLIEGGFLGGYHRKKSTSTGETLDVINKNEYSHIMDAHQFALCFASALDDTIHSTEDNQTKPIQRELAEYEKRLATA